MNKTSIDELVEKFETPDFIKADPVQFPHRFSKKQDIEVSGFISSAFAYGKREKIIENLEFIHAILGDSPYEFVLNFDINKDFELFKGFKYRYTGERDILCLLHVLGQILKKFDSLEDAFLQGFSRSDINVRKGLVNFVNLLRRELPCTGHGILQHANSGLAVQNDECKDIDGARTPLLLTKCQEKKEGSAPYGETCEKSFKHLVPSPENGSACKRLNLFLKWMVRKPPVDLGIWKGISSDKLIIPLDVHVARVSLLWGLTERTSNDWKKAEEITENLKKFDANDPAKYDFAIFGAGITGLYKE